jgi:hypothetical protein
MARRPRLGSKRVIVYVVKTHKGYVGNVGRALREAAGNNQSGK